MAGDTLDLYRAHVRKDDATVREVDLNFVGAIECRDALRFERGIDSRGTVVVPQDVSCLAIMDFPSRSFGQMLGEPIFRSDINCVASLSARAATTSYLSSPYASWA